MSHRTNNHLVCDLSKGSYAILHWITHSFGTTYRRVQKPTEPTVNGHEFETSSAHSTSETMLEYATRRGLLDNWQPEFTLQLSNSHSLVYTGKKALSLWEAWKAKQFGQRKEK